MENIKIALCMPFRNDEDTLPWTLKKIPQSYFDDFIFINTGSTNNSERIIAENFPKGVCLNDRIDHIDFGKWRNMLIQEAEKRGNQWCLMLDSDETMFEESYALIQQYIMEAENTAFRFSRIDFVNDTQHIRTDVFPDWQGRLFKLKMGYYYAPKVHAQLHLNNELIQGQFIPHITIFHYGWTRDIYKKKLHYYNVERTQQNLPMVDKLPDDYPLSSASGKHAPSEWKVTKYIGKQP